MGLAVLVRVLVLVTFFGCCDVAGAQTLPSIGGGDKKEDKSDDAPPNVIKTDTAEIEASYASWQEQLTALEAKLVELEKADTRSSSEITLLSEKLQIMTGELTEVRMRAEEAKSGPERALNAIGAPPKEKERPEATAIADERQLHQRDLARIEAALTFVRVANARADDLVERLALLGERKFSNWILERRDSLDVLGSTSELTGLADPVRSMRVPDLPEITSLSRGWHVMLSAVALVISAALFLWILPRARAAAAAQETDALPPRRQIALLRFASAVGSGILPAMIFLALAWFCVVTLATSGTVWIAVLVCGLVGLATYMGFYKILHAALAPKNQILRIPNLNDEAAQRLNGLLRALCALVAVCCAIYLAVTFAQRTPDSVVDLLKFATTIGFAALFAIGLRHPIMSEAAAPQRRRRPRHIRFALIAATMLFVAAAVFGFINLAVFAIVHIAGSVLLLFATYFVRPILHDGLRAAFSKDESSYDNDTQSWLETGSHVLLDVIVLVSFGLIMLGFWGVPLDAVWLWLKQRSGNITIGEFSLSIGDIFIAIATFVVVFVISRLIVKFIRNRVLDHTAIDRGIRDSIEVALGYIGFIIAAAAAVAALGVNLTSLALIFGALSLGVGFGLQNTVDNFVSGLILLIQRPIKSGDWINIENHEGFVKSIGVISTEITTFEEASVIVPNSELISSAVVNRTLGLSRGRVDVPVGVAYGSDVANVLQILRDCAAENEKVLDDPEPSVVMMSFNDSSLDFELRAFIPDIRDLFTVATELRVAILERFRREDVEIPFPQRDLHLRSATELVTVSSEPDNQSETNDDEADDDELSSANNDDDATTKD